MASGILNSATLAFANTKYRWDWMSVIHKNIQDIKRFKLLVVLDEKSGDHRSHQDSLSGKQLVSPLLWIIHSTHWQLFSQGLFLWLESILWHGAVCDLLNLEVSSGPGVLRLLNQLAFVSASQCINLRSKPEVTGQCLWGVVLFVFVFVMFPVWSSTGQDGRVVTVPQWKVHTDKTVCA